MGGAHISVFLGSALVLLIVPGPAVLFIVSRSLSGGVRAGMVSIAGIALAGVVHVLLAAAGLSAIVAASVAVFRLIQFAGAGYLAYLGLAKLLEPSPTPGPAGRPPARAGRLLFWDGFTVQLMNPKLALFLLSFLPQFVSPAQGKVSLQVLVLGLLFIFTGFLTDTAYALAAGRFHARWSGASDSTAALGKWVHGLTYLVLGVVTAISR